MERLQKHLAHAGVASRRKCEEMILAGKVKVNGKTINELGTKIDPLKDKIIVDGVLLQKTEKKIYLMLNKPRGCVSTVKDDRGRKTVMEFVKNVKERLYPVGRLDYDSEGLILLTNDGEMANILTHPSHKISKLYKARVKGIPTLDKLELLSRGVKLEDGITAPAKVFMKHILNDNALLEITIHEGRNRQVRRMCDFIGHEVLRLVRTGLGPLELRDLKSGEIRELSAKELRLLREAVGIKTEKRKRKY